MCSSHILVVQFHNPPRNIMTKNDIQISKPIKYRLSYPDNRYTTLQVLTGENQNIWVDSFSFVGQSGADATPINQRFGANSVPFYAELNMLGHNGIDWNAKHGTCLYSPINGVVISKVDSSTDKGYGQNIDILSDEITVDGKRYRFEVVEGHLCAEYVSVNQRVTRGMFIGLCDNCFDKETEILTDGGWKYFKDLNGTEKVATLNIDKDELEFQKPLKYTKKYEEYMNLCNSGKANFCVSDDHNMLVYYGRKQDKLKLVEYSKLPNKHRIKFKHTTNWTGKEELKKIIKPIYKKQGFLKDKYCPEIEIDMDLWLEFLGILIADGYIDIKRNRISITQSTSYKDNIKTIQDIFDRLPFHYNKCERKQFEKYNSVITWSIVDKQLIEELKDIGKKEYKKAPEYIKELSSRQIQIFLDSFFMGDGYERRNKEKYYYPGLSKILANQIQEYLLKTGRCGNVSERILNVEKNYQVYEHNSNNSWIVKDECKRVLYNDYAYCVSVPNRTLYVRRNGRPMFLGNTGKYTTGNHLHEGFRQLEPISQLVNNYTPHWYLSGWGYKNNGYLGYIDHENLIDNINVMSRIELANWEGKYIQLTDAPGGFYKVVNNEIIPVSSEKDPVTRHIPLVDEIIRIMNKQGIVKGVNQDTINRLLNV